MRHDDYPDVPGTLAVALTLWGGAVAAGTRSGIFLRLAPEAYAALAAFAIAFALSVVTVDPRVRGWLDRRGALAGWLAAAGIAGLLVAAGIGLSDATGIEAAAAPWAPLLLFGVPVTAAAALAAIRASWRERQAAVVNSGFFRSPASTAPAQHRASP